MYKLVVATVAVYMYDPGTKMVYNVYMFVLSIAFFSTVISLPPPCRVKLMAPVEFVIMPSVISYETATILLEDLR